MALEQNMLLGTVGHLSKVVVGHIIASGTLGHLTRVEQSSCWASAQVPNNYSAQVPKPTNLTENDAFSNREWPSTEFQ